MFVNVVLAVSLFRYPALSLSELDVLYETSWSHPNDQLDETGATSFDLAQEYGMRLAKSLGWTILKDCVYWIMALDAGRNVKSPSGPRSRSLRRRNPLAMSFCRDQGFRVFRSLSEVPENVKFDGIVSLDVIEHVLVPWETYGDLQRYLVKRGWLYLSTPNAGGINAQYFRSKWRELYNRGHLFFFTSRNFRINLRKTVPLKSKGFDGLSIIIGVSSPPLCTGCFNFLLRDGELRYLIFKWISVEHIKVLHAHNYYLQSGGEDTAFNAEVNLPFVIMGLKSLNMSRIITILQLEVS